MRLSGVARQAALLTRRRPVHGCSGGAVRLGRRHVAQDDLRDRAAPFACPSPAHWWKYASAWTTSHYGTYFWNSTVIVVGAWRS